MRILFLLLFTALPTFAQLPDPHQSVLSLNGTSYLSVPYSTGLNYDVMMSQAISIDAWVKPSVLGTYMTIVGNDFVNGYWLGITPTGKIRFYPKGSTLYESTGSIAVNTWSHVGVSVNAANGTIQFFINGVLNNTISVTRFTLGMSSSDLRIGADRTGTAADYFWKGELDEVRIWKYDMDFGSALGLLYRVPQGVINGLHGRFLAGSWQLNGDGGDVSGTHVGSPVGSPTYLSAPLPPHYPRICGVFSNGPNSSDLFSFSSPSLNLIQNYTIELWVNPSATGGDPNLQTLVSKGQLANAQWTYWLGINKSNGRVRFVGNGDAASFLESSSALPTGQWSHVAARCQSTGSNLTLDIFINGVSAGQRTVALGGSSNQLPMQVGLSQAGATAGNVYGFAGKIDELRLWNTARSLAQIQDNMRLEWSGWSPGLVALYHFNGDLYDGSSNNNHGTSTLTSNSSIYFTDATDLPPAPTIVVTAPNGGENWRIGTMNTIRWNASGLFTVIVELSRDGGASFTPLTPTPLAASVGQFVWTTTDPTTTNALVRVTTPTLTTVSDVSNAVFSISEPPPHLVAVPEALQFSAMANGDPPLPRPVRLTNTGGGTLQWSATVQNGPWMITTPSSGAGNMDSLYVQITRTDLTPGTYQGRVVLGGNADNPGVQIPVTYTVLRPPCIAFSRDTVIFLATQGMTPAPQFVTIRNGCDSLLFWTASARDAWVSVSPPSGVQGDRLRLAVTTTGFAVGDYESLVEVSGNASNSPRLLVVILKVLSTPMYTLSGTVRDGGIGVPGVTMTVTGTLDLSVETGPDGSYSVGVMAGDYTLTPSSPFYTFTPTSRAATGVNGNRTGLDFDGRIQRGTAFFRVKEGWNLLSLPVRPTDPRLAAVFPTALSPAYAYHPDSGYVVRTMLEPGRGYWIKFPAPDSMAVTGEYLASVTLLAAGRNGGWNLIGGPSGPALLSHATEVPESSIVAVYGYDPETGYAIPGDGSVRPGHGYFLRVRRDAQVGLFAATLARVSTLISERPSILLRAESAR